MFGPIQEEFDRFLRRFVTMNEAWVHHYAPKIEQQSKQWVEAGDSVPKKAKSIASAGMVMASVFCDAKGILLIDYLEKGRAITGEYYSHLLDPLHMLLVPGKIIMGIGKDRDLLLEKDSDQ